MSRFPLFPRVLFLAALAFAPGSGFGEDSPDAPVLPLLKKDFEQELSEESKAALLRKIAALDETAKATPNDPAIRAQLGTAYFQLGGGYLKTGKAKESIEAFRKAVDLSPTNAQAWEGLGMGLGTLDKIDEALDALQRAENADPQSADIRIAHGGMLLKAGKISEAVAAFSKARELDPDSRGPHAILGFTLLQAGKPKEALQEFDQALKIEPKDSETLCNRGLALLGMNDLPGAIAAMQSAIEAKPENLVARRNLAAFLAKARRYDEVEVEAKTLIERESSDKTAWALLGEANIRRERYKDGVEALEKALSLGFVSPEASLELVEGLVAVGRLDDADKTLAGLTSNASLKPYVLASLGNLRKQQKRLEESNRYAEEALALDPKNITALMTLANNSLTANQPDKAIQYANQTIAADASSWRAWGVIALAEEQRSRPADALLAYRKVIEMVPTQFAGWQGVVRLSNDESEAYAAAAKTLEFAPNDPAAQVALPYTQARFGKYSEAFASYESALTKYPRNVMMAEEYSKLISSQRGPEQALQKFQSLVEQKPEWPLGWRMVGYNLVMMGRYAEAEEPLQKAIHLDESNPIFWKDLGVVYITLFQLHDSIRFAVKAEEALRKALELDPKLAAASLQLSLALLAQHRAIEAEEFCNQAIQSGGNSLYAWQALSKIRGAQGHFPEAIQAIETAIKLSPKDISSWREFRDLCTQRNDPAAHEKELRRLLTELPDASLGWNWLAILLMGEGKKEAATDAAKKAVELDGKDANAWDTYGATQVTAGHFEEAIEPLKKAVSIRPDHPSAWSTLGYVYFKLGRMEESIDGVRHALKINPKSVKDWRVLAAGSSQKGDMETVKDACDHLAEIDPAAADQLRRQFLK